MGSIWFVIGFTYFHFQESIEIIDITDSPVKAPAAVIHIEESPVKKKRKLEDDQKFLDEDPEKPMLLLGKSVSVNKIVSLLFHPEPDVVCTKQPLKVKTECSFLVDLRRITLEDLRADGNPPYDKYAFFLQVITLSCAL